MNSTDIISALELSSAAYRDVQPHTDHTLIVFADEGRAAGATYFLRKRGDTLWITFRGTDRPREWKSNFDFCRKIIPYDNNDTKIRVHEGFLNAYKNSEVRDKILKFISDNSDSIKRVRISGHSRGAALALLCAVDIQYNYPRKDIEAVVFGCPRVGNKAFVLSYNKRVDKTVRVENGNDVVTKVPLAIMGFWHAGAKLSVGKRRVFFIASANDHYPHNYYSALLSKTVK